MALLDRYKKTGGFVQLLQLIETTNPGKRAQFIKMIEDEDPRWADAIHQRMLTIERIFSWDDNTIAEVVGSLHELTLAIALHALGKEREEKVFRTFSSGKKRRILELMENKVPTAAEVSSSYVKIIEEVRDLIKQGHVRLEKVDAELVIQENIEEKLASQLLPDAITSPTIVAPTAGAPTEDAPTNRAAPDTISTEKLVQQLTLLSSENKKLKSELKILKDKLEQIKRIA
jgi:hypothetical protein